MKAFVYRNYGSPALLELKETEKPAPKEDKVLVKVRAPSVLPAQWHTLIGLFNARREIRILKPKNTRLSADFAGAVGKVVTHLKHGDGVLDGRTMAFAGNMDVHDAGTSKTANLTLEQPAAVLTAAVPG